MPTLSSRMIMMMMAMIIKMVMVMTMIMKMIVMMTMIMKMMMMMTMIMMMMTMIMMMMTMIMIMMTMVMKMMMMMTSELSCSCCSRGQGLSFKVLKQNPTSKYHSQTTKYWHKISSNQFFNLQVSLSNIFGPPNKILKFS